MTFGTSLWVGCGSAGDEWSGAVGRLVSPMAAAVTPSPPTRVECPRCSWPVVHRDVMLGLCPRCGRHLPARLLG